jgi:Bcr/CflA subfamily drug resistance transporter
MNPMLPAPSSPPRLTTLILLSALGVLPVVMYLPSLPHIAETFHADYALVNLSIVGYAVVSAALQLVMGPLSDRLGRRPVILAGLVIFIAASLGCALAPDIRIFLACRLLQATVISAYAVSLAVVRDTSGERQAASLIGRIATAWAIAPMLGPLLGGALDELFGWRACFWSFVLFGIAVLVLTVLDLGETNESPSRTIAEQFRTYPKLFRSQLFWAHSGCMALSTGAFYAYLSGAPLVAKTLFDMPPAMLGFFMGTITAGFVFGSFLSGRFASRYPLTTTMIGGNLVSCAGMVLGLALFFAGAVHVLSFFGPCVLVGVGNGLTTPSASAGALSVHPKLAGSASGLSGALMVSGGAALSSLTGAVLTEANAAAGLLTIMLLASLVALLAALYALRLGRRFATA